MKKVSPLKICTGDESIYMRNIHVFWGKEDLIHTLRPTDKNRIYTIHYLPLSKERKTRCEYPQKKWIAVPMKMSQLKQFASARIAPLIPAFPHPDNIPRCPRGQFFILHPHSLRDENRHNILIHFSCCGNPPGPWLFRTNSPVFSYFSSSRYKKF